MWKWDSSAIFLQNHLTVRSLVISISHFQERLFRGWTIFLSSCRPIPGIHFWSIHIIMSTCRIPSDRMTNSSGYSSTTLLEYFQSSINIIWSDNLHSSFFFFTRWSSRVVAPTYVFIPGLVHSCVCFLFRFAGGNGAGVTGGGLGLGGYLPYHLFWPPVTETIWSHCQNLIREWKSRGGAEWLKQRRKSTDFWETRWREREAD